jgi:hypothetical protein
MSQFATIVRDRVSRAHASGQLVSRDRPSIDGAQGQQALGAGLELVQRLVTSNAACAQDDDCKEVTSVLMVAQTGSDADTRTALTRLQRLLANLTAADSDIADDAGVQLFRRQLHLALDHG